MTHRPDQLETDPRFPSGRWVGFWLQKQVPPGRFETELLLTFRDGILTGEGRDWVGLYTVRGHYNLADGRCDWIKTYTGRHDVYYQGFNEGKGIWGTWVIPGRLTGLQLHGGFHIWPEGMADPTGSHLTESAEAPVEAEKEVKHQEPLAVPTG
jgi:hypothetical protein